MVVVKRTMCMMMVSFTLAWMYIRVPTEPFASPWSDRNDLACNVNTNGYTSADYFGVMWNSGGTIASNKLKKKSLSG